LISLKLDPGHHPFTTDGLWPLFLQGVVASMRRFDVSVAMKALFILWFGAMAAAPRPAASWLATRFLFPETRPGLNRLLGRLHRAGA
jgi:hypothetical protein